MDFQEVMKRVQRSLEQMQRESGSLPEGSLNVIIRDGEIKISATGGPVSQDKGIVSDHERSEIFIPTPNPTIKKKQ